MFPTSNLKFKIVEVATLCVLTADMVNDPLARNVRELDNYDLAPLIEDLKERGLQEEIWVYPSGEKSDGCDTLVPVKGFRRRQAWGNLLEQFPDGYKYKDSDGKDHVRRFDKIRVRLYGALSPTDRINLMLDHGQRKGLNKVELQNAFERAFAVQMTEKQVAIILKGLLIENYPPSRKFEETPEKLLGYYRGVIQTAKRIYELPDVAREACLKKLGGDQTWPTNSEIVEAHKVYTDEEKADTTGAINRGNPGPKFLQHWQKLLVVKAEAAASGAARGKSAAMMNRQQTEDAAKQSRSLIVKRVFHVQLRRVAVDKLPVIDKIALELEKHLTDEMRQILSDMGKDEDTAVADAAASTPTEESPTEESPTESEEKTEEKIEENQQIVNT